MYICRPLYICTMHVDMYICGPINVAAGGVPSWNETYDRLLSGPLLNYLKASQRIGDDVLTQASVY